MNASSFSYFLRKHIVYELFYCIGLYSVGNIKHELDMQEYSL